MAKTIEQLKAQGAEVKNATVVGENTATRVGTLFTDIVEHVEQYETGQTANTEANTLAINNEAQARSKADEQLNTAIEAEVTRAKAAEQANATAIETETARATAAEEAIIFDVSENNDSAVFESLQALLSSSNLSTLIPTSVRNGGMTIRFIQGSEPNPDNKYVQFTYMGVSVAGTPNPFVNIKNWQKNDVVNMLNQSDTDLDISDEVGYVVARFKNGHIKTKSFDSQSIVNKLNTIKEGAEVNDTETANCLETDLDIVDENRNILARFSEGHVKTKKFDSRDLQIQNDGDYPFSLKDDNDKTAFVLKQNGHIKTKSFDSEIIQIDNNNGTEAFTLKDDEDNVSFSITNEGHIRTKNFNSKDTYTNKNLNISPILPTSFSRFGNYTDSSIPDNYIVTNGIMTQRNIKMQDGLLLTSLHFYANRSGKIHFGIGNIDQRNWAIVSQEFDVNCVQGINDIDIIELGIIGTKNGYLFAFNNYFGDGCSIGYILRTSPSTNNLVFSDTINGALAELDVSAAPNSAYPALSYKQSTSKSIYDFKDVASNGRKETEQITNKVAYIQNYINEIKGADGNFYKIIVDDNGNIGTQRVNYGKITVFGNSIWQHDAISNWLYPLAGDNDSTWTYTGESESAIGMSGRGMGATTQAFDFKHLFRRGMQINFPSVIVQGANIANIERNLPNDFGFESLLTSDVDIIFWRAGENVSADPIQYASALRRYFTYFKQRCPNAKIIATGRFWNSVNSDNAVKEVCDEFCIPYIKMYMDNIDLYQARKYDIVSLPMKNSVSGVVETKYEIVDGGAGHPSNLGFLEIANRMLMSLNKMPLILTYKVVVENIGGYEYECRNLGIEGELYTINIYNTLANVVVKDEQANVISTTILTSSIVTKLSNNMLACVFTMPSSNIIITLN